MHPAAPVEAADGARLAPPLHRLGPLLGHVVLGEALQGAHELAVDDPGRQRVEVPGDGRDPGLVEQHQTLLDIAVQDEQPGFRHPSERPCRRVGRRIHLHGLPDPPPSAGQVAGQHPLVGADDRKPPVRRRLTPTFEQPLRSGQPAAHRCHEGGVEEQVHRDANGCSCGPDRITGLQARGVGPLPRLDGHIEMAGRVSDLAEHWQLGGRQEAVRVRLQEQVERLPYRPWRSEHLGTLGDHVLDQTRALVGEAVVVVAPAGRGEQDVEARHLGPPGQVVGLLQPLAVLDGL